MKKTQIVAFETFGEGFFLPGCGQADIEQHLSVSKLGKLVFTQQHHVLVQAADNHLILSKKFLQRQELEAFRSEEHTSELQSRGHLVCRLLLEKKKTTQCR